METTNIGHQSAFNTINGIEGLNVATREIFENFIIEQAHQLEGMALRNSYIAIENYTGGMGNTAFSQTTFNNPAGTFRTSIMPKENDMVDFEPIEGMSDIKFSKASIDTISLAIDTYSRTSTKLIYEIDAGSNSWMPADLRNAITAQMLNNMTRKINWEIYGKLKVGAISQMDNIKGAGGRVIETSDDSKEFMEQLLTAIAEMYTMPDDRYTDGFDKSEQVIAISALAQKKLLVEKLVMYDGQFMGTEGKFFNGLPYAHTLGGTPLYVTRWMQPAKGKNATGDTIEAEWLMLPPGRLSPLLFHLAHFSGRAEIAPFTDGATGIYGTMVYGIKVEDKLTQYISMGVKKGSAITNPGYEGTMKNIFVSNNTTDSTTINVEVEGTDVMYKVTKLNETDSLQWLPGTIEDNKLVISNLASKTEYRVLIAGAKDGLVQISPITQKELKFTVFPKTI